MSPDLPVTPGPSLSPRGRLITFEGGEGSGKSTQLHLLGNRLLRKGHTVHFTREPGGTQMAEALRHIVFDTGRAIEALQLAYPHLKALPSDWDYHDGLTDNLLILASRAYHTRLLRLLLEEGDAVVLCDRYIDSAFAYPAANGVDESVSRVVHEQMELVPPDLTILLDLDPKIGLARRLAARGPDPAAGNRYDEKDLAFHTTVRTVLLARAQAYPERIVVLDADRPREILAEEIAHVVARSLDL